MFWMPVLVASFGAYLLKVGGFFVPQKLMDNQRFRNVSALLPIGLLGGLIVVQAFADGKSLTLDGRVVGLIIAIPLLMKKAPFIVVVFSAALVAAALRYFGFAI
jgi:hypothetical protein